MQAVTVVLPDLLFAELKTAAAEVSREMTFGPERWAAEAIEAALASRRARVRLQITREDVFQRKPVELDAEDYE